MTPKTTQTPEDLKDPTQNEQTVEHYEQGGLALDLSEEIVTREQRRSRRKRAVRARTISVKRMTKRELELGRMLYPETDHPKPRTRAECLDGPRPCPYVSCAYHLYLDVQARTGAIKLNFPNIEVEDMNESCALDVADRGGTTLEEVGAIMNLTRERIRQLEVRALANVAELNRMEALREVADESPLGKRRLHLITKRDDKSKDPYESFGVSDSDKFDGEDYAVDGFDISYLEAGVSDFVHGAHDRKPLGQQAQPEKTTSLGAACRHFEQIEQKMSSGELTDEEWVFYADHAENCHSGAHSAAALEAELSLLPGALQHGDPKQQFPSPKKVFFAALLDVLTAIEEDESDEDNEEDEGEDEEDEGEDDELDGDINDFDWSDDLSPRFGRRLHSGVPSPDSQGRPAEPDRALAVRPNFTVEPGGSPIEASAGELPVGAVGDGCQPDHPKGGPKVRVAPRLMGVEVNPHHDGGISRLEPSGVAPRVTANVQTCRQQPPTPGRAGSPPPAVAWSPSAPMPSSDDRAGARS